MVIINKDEQHDLFNFIIGIVDDEEFQQITDEIIEWWEDDYPDSSFDLNQLKNYTVIYSLDGEHKSDYQLVDYTFKFSSPQGVTTVVTIPNSLVGGFSIEVNLDISV